MKRFSKDICNLETRMRKKAALDLAREQEKEQQEIARKRSIVRYGDKGELIYTLDTLPTWMMHLGDYNMVEVNCFSGYPRVDIRKYVPDEKEGLHPTKEGVSVSPDVWDSLLEELNSILNKDSKDMVIVKKDLCLSRQLVDGETLVSLQRLFQRRNHSLEFIPKWIVLKPKHVNKLDKCSEDISQIVKEAFIRLTMDSFVKKELENFSQSHCAEIEPDNPEGFSELFKVLVKCMKQCIATRIFELFQCDGCKEPTPFNFHSCLNMSIEDKFADYFISALYTLDWKQLSHEFVKENVSNCHFQNLIFSFDFFSNLDVNNLFKEIEDLYIQEENVLYQSALTIWE